MVEFPGPAGGLGVEDPDNEGELLYFGFGHVAANKKGFLPDWKPGRKP